MKKSLIFKLVLGICLVSVITFGISALLIFYLKQYIVPDMDDKLFIFIVLDLGMIWTGILGWIAARHFIRPLVRLTESVDIVADGNLNVKIPEYKGQDEVGRLHRSFQTMLDNLHGMISDVTGSVKVQEQNMGALESAIKQATEQIESISSSVENLASGAAVQAESAKKLLMTVEEAAQSAEDISKEAEHAIHITRTMTGNIKESEVQVRSLVDGMNHIATTSEKTLSIVQTLEQQADEITQITKLVGEIADQTHLLALNASIEATHAGEHGHGFAVVAHQIRKLAADSSSAVEKITHLVKEMQQLTHTVVSESEGQVKLILKETSGGEKARVVLDEVVASVDEAASAMHSIVGHINTQTEQINQTFEMVKQITDSSLLISENNAKISETIQEQTAVMEEIAATSEQVSSEAVGLKEKAVIFKL